jgi:hypothetical protein
MPKHSGMQLRLAAPVAVLALAGATVPAVASPPTRTRVEYAAAHVVRGDFGAATGSATAWASKALRSQGKRLGVDAGAFRWEVVRTSLIGTHVRGRQYRDGLPVDGTSVLVSAIAGRVAQIDALGTDLPGSKAAAPVGDLVAKAAALGHLEVASLLVPANVVRVLQARRGELVDTYQVTVVAPGRIGRVDVDAATGRVLGVIDDSRYDDGSARVFDPNPVVTSRNTSLRQDAEVAGVAVPLAQPELTAQLQTLPAKGIDAGQLSLGILTGPNAHLVAPVGFTSTDLSFSRTDPRFVGAMAYVHVDRYQRWLQSLGLHVNEEAQQLAPTLLEGYDNSQFVPSVDLIVYGGGGVPDAEDAEVVLHEYGHAMQDDQVPGYLGSGETGAMGEGFGDFNAANYFALTSKGFSDTCVAEWDSTSYATTNPPCLRRLDSGKRYPAGLDGDVHDDGELWSAYLWRLRSHLGSSTQARTVNAIRLVAASHELEAFDATFASSVAALRTAARAMRHSDWATWVDREAKVSGFGLNP